MHLSALPRDSLLMPRRRSQELLVILQPRDDPMPIGLLTTAYRHLRLSVSLQALLAFLRDMREPERFGFQGMHPVSARRGSGPIRCSVGCGVA